MDTRVIETFTNTLFVTENALKVHDTNIPLPPTNNYCA